jgi:hypothetical protein
MRNVGYQIQEPGQQLLQSVFLIDKIIFQEFYGDHGPVSSSLLRQVGYRAFLININLQKIRYTAYFPETGRRTLSALVLP